MAETVKFKPLVYPAKILLAWGEAIGGNKKIRETNGREMIHSGTV